MQVLSWDPLAKAIQLLALQTNCHSGETRSGPDNLHCGAE